MKYLLIASIFASTLFGWDFSYNMGMEQIKETVTLTNTFSISQVVSPAVSLNGNTSFSARRDEGLSQFTDSRNVTGSLNWRPITGVELASSFAKSISLEDRYDVRVRDDRRESATGSIRYSTGTWLTTNVSVGLQNRDYILESGSGNNDGYFYRVNSTVNKTVFDVVNTSISFYENRSYGNEADIYSDELSARMSYYFPEEFRGGSISSEISGSKNTQVFIDSLESQLGDSWSHSEVLELPVLIPGVFINFSTNWSAKDVFWQEDHPDSTGVDPRNNDQSSRSLRSNLFWEMNENIELDFSFSRALTFRENTIEVYGTDDQYLQEEDTDTKLLDISLVYTPGSSRVAFQRIVELYSYDTIVDHGDTSSVYVNDFDRDEYRDLLGITASIPTSDRLTLTCSMIGQQRSSYYLKASQSANSRTSSTYSFNPGYKYSLGDGWSISQNMKITANYTKYHFDESISDDRLFRRLDESFSLSRTTSDSTTLGISHRFTFNDQGTFEDDIFARSEESLNNKISFDAGFHVSSTVGLTPSYTYEYATRNRLDLFTKTVDHIHHVGIRTSFDVLDGTFNTNITRTFYTSSSRESYWKANVGYSLRM